MKKSLLKKDFVSRAKGYHNEKENIGKKYKIGEIATIMFLSRTKVPLSCKFAIWLLKVKGGRLDIKFLDLMKE